MGIIGRILTISFVFSFSIAAHAFERSCGGGDGPTPLKNHPAVNADLQFVSSIGTIKEFAVSERFQQVLYRTDFGSVAATELTSGNTRVLTSSGLPLSRLLEPSGHFLLTEAA